MPCGGCSVSDNPLQTARAVINADLEDRAARCLQRVRAVLQEEHCVMVGVPRLTADGRIVADVNLIAQPVNDGE